MNLQTKTSRPSIGLRLGFIALGISVVLLAYAPILTLAARVVA